jgi:hypothetical protein
MMVEAAHLVTVVHGTIVAMMAGIDANGQGFGGAGGQHGKGEGSDNEFFHDNDPWKRCRGNAA